MHKLRKLFRRNRTFITEVMACIGVAIILFLLMMVPRVEGADPEFIIASTLFGFVFVLLIFGLLYLDHRLQQKKRFQELNERLRNPKINSNTEYHKFDR